MIRMKKREIRKIGGTWQYIEKSCDTDRVLKILMESSDHEELNNMVIGWERKDESRNTYFVTK